MNSESYAQDITGRWYSKITVNNETFHYLLDIRKRDHRFVGYLDLPAEKKFRIRLDSISLATDHTVFFQHKGLAFQLKGATNEQATTIKGKVTRNDSTSNITLSRQPQVSRTQIVEEPIPYESEEVYFYNKDSTRLAGTITYPTVGNPSTAVVLITGSGPQNRNEEILGHQPFLILADFLTRQGIAVLRYDDRGYGQSEGQFRPATSLDYADDALAAVQFLKNTEKLSIQKIGLIGHSEGGNIAPVVATQDAIVQFLILLAAPGTSNLASYLVSLDLILQAYPATYNRDYPFFKSVYEDMAAISDKSILKDSLQNKFTRIADQMETAEFTTYGGKSNYINSQVNYHTSDWYHHYLQFDVTDYLTQLKIPILALNGDKDTSVEAAFNLEGIEATLTKANHPNFETVMLENVNHFFQVSADDKIESVYFNEETFSKVALEKIAEWIMEF